MSRVVLYVACPLRPTEIEIAAIPDDWDSMAAPREGDHAFGGTARVGVGDGNRWTSNRGIIR